MSKSLIIKSLLVWLLFVPIAVLNGIVRNYIYQPHVGELLAHQISTVIACATFILLAYFLLKHEVVNQTTNMLLLIGLMWILMTIVFEFGFGHWVAGHSWEKLLHDYNILKGRVWILFLLNSLITPLLIKRLTKK